MRHAAGRTIAHAALAAGAALAVCVLSALALLVTLICAAPLKAMAECVRNQPRRPGRSVSCGPR